MALTGFKYSRGGRGYAFDYNGRQIIAKMIEASRLAINDVTREAARLAREEHMWDNRSGQTEAAVFQRDAVFETEWTTSHGVLGPHVWGEWGVEDRPRFSDYDRERGTGTELEKVSTKDVALFLEFGTVNMAARPWLYPVWDQTKRLLPATVAFYYRQLTPAGKYKQVSTDPFTKRFVSFGTHPFL